MAFTAFDKNHGFRDFRVSVIIYCPYLCCLLFLQSLALVVLGAVVE